MGSIPVRVTKKRRHPLGCLLFLPVRESKGRINAAIDFAMNVGAIMDRPQKQRENELQEIYCDIITVDFFLFLYYNLAKEILKKEF